MMKLAFSTLGCPDWTLERVVDQAGHIGYDGVELRFLEGDDCLWERPELQGDGLRETKRRLADAGLSIPCVDSRSFFHHPDPAARRAALDEAKRTIEIAARLGAPGIRVFGDRVQAGADLVSTRGWVAEALAALRDEARGSGVEIWLESHGDFATGTAVRSVLALVGDEGVGVLWDPANAFTEFGEEPEEGGELLGKAIRHVHLKDGRRQPPSPAEEFRPWTPTLLGAGDVPAARTLGWLRHAGYDAWVSFEWEKRWHPEIAEAEIALPHFLRWAADELRGRPRGGAEGARVFPCGRMDVEVHPERPATGAAAALVVADHIRASIDRDGRAAVIFASAPSQNEFLAALRDSPGIDWSKLVAFHLDEYVGIPADHPASFRRFLTDRLFDHVPVRAFHGLDGGAADLEAECARYAALLRAVRPSLAILGIGENGHLAFIDPPVCDFFEAADVRVVELDGVCRQQQVHDGCFARLADVPRTALSLTVPFLMSVPRVVAIVPGPAKRDAIRAAVEGPATTACPASILRRHRDATLFLDGESASGLLR